ncbi:2Fe-2S iron-sulfur cluster binding domain-containing protein [Sphaerochaeta sp. PS]|uniref:NADH:ubiquinone reductase (Na(+)-transporting) subunit F n=1 Tax=Sphaerochaeta sp. PS TaxID=3076336 RepID=UPI0028A3F5AD|nr:2Fe-2S iron-sulfur cluster binding domain-containing protein [Sphaerochaeta sp. PS]MDT4762500.1 2Fe-2S iron-sulfur cluster binding domain-containing protein [Sphaerochaeta sp. PS]
MVITLLISIGIISLLSVFLAILMVIADATIGNYGTVKISINDGSKVLEVDGGQPLLRALNQEGVFIPSACGGRGSCGLCKVKVVSGGGDYLPTELPFISDEERKQLIRLSCQVKVKTDVAIVIPEELFLVKEFTTVVESIKDLTHDIKQVTLSLKDPTEISTKAGQYIQFVVPEYEDSDESVYRAYSMASPPGDSKHVELEIRLVPNGICTTYVHKHLKEGDEVIINGPYGEFYLRDTERNIIFIAGGSGMAPIKSMLLDMEKKGSTRKTTYFFGARSKRDLFLLDEMKALEKTIPNFTFVPALSEPQAEDKWEGEVGLITDVVRRMVSEGSNSEAYLCGSPGMIDACIKVLHELEVPPENVFYDKF